MPDGSVVRAHLALLLVTTIWGLAYLGTKVALVDLGPFQAAALRVAISAAVFLPAYRATRRAIGRRDSALLGVLGVVAYYGTFNVGLQTARTTDAGVIQASIPAVTGLLAIPLLGERPRWAVWAGIALSTAGVVLLVSQTTGASREGSLIGDLWIVGSVLDWALYSIVIRRISRSASAVAITAATLVWGAILLVPLALAELAFVRPTLSVASAAATLYLAILAGALGYWLYSYGLARVAAAPATTYLNLLPLVAASSGVLILGERIGVTELAAGAIIVVGVSLATAVRR
jgi:drug/metabolite transporter (DMT)-like permease